MLKDCTELVKGTLNFVNAHVISVEVEGAILRAFNF